MSLSIPIYKGRKRRAPALAVLLIVVLALLGAAGWLHFRYPTTSPVTSARYLIAQAGKTHANLNRDVAGFLPYWRLDDTRYMRPDLLSEVIYFSLSVDHTGQLVKSVNDQPDPGWRWWNSSTVRDQIARTQIAGDKFLLSVAMQDPREIGAFLQLGGSQQTLLDNLLNQVKSNRLNGINLDVELDGKASDDQRSAFTAFARKLSAAFHQEAPGAELSIDLPPRAARDPGLYDVPALAPLFDHVIVMSYDYYAAGSDVAGPVAPMSGFANHTYFFDVDTTYADFAKVVPKEKLIMGVPYYGYDWPVKDASKPMAPTSGPAAILSYSRLKTDTDIKPSDCHWDAIAQETWCAYLDPQTNTPREAWVEDERSIAAKYDFARGQGLGGVAIWTLGYDGAYADLWNLVRATFTSAPAASASGSP